MSGSAVIKSTCIMAAMILWGRADAPRIFSMPGSELLFARYAALRISYPDRVLSISPPAESSANDGYLAYPSIARDGALIAWGFAHDVPDPRFTLGLWSSESRQWKTYGAFEAIGATAISTDKSMIAVAGQMGSRKGVFAFSPSSETFSALPTPAGVPANASLSWSPDSKRLVVEIQQGGRASTIAVLELSTGSIHRLAEGSDPAWSPTGEWIAYYDRNGARCVLIHPDGSGSTV